MYNIIVPIRIYINNARMCTRVRVCVCVYTTTTYLITNAAFLKNVYIYFGFLFYFQ